MTDGHWVPLPTLDMAEPSTVRRPVAQPDREFVERARQALVEADRDITLAAWAQAVDGKPARVDLATPARTERERLLDAWEAAA